MADPDWAKILDYLYNNKGYIRVEPDSENENELDRLIHVQSLYEKLDSEIALQANNYYEFEKSCTYLSNLNLVRYTSDQSHLSIEMNQNGFNVAHERKLSNRRHKSNVALVLFTLTLVVVTAITGYPNELVQSVGVLLILLFIIALSYKTDILEL